MDKRQASQDHARGSVLDTTDAPLRSATILNLEVATGISCSFFPSMLLSYLGHSVVDQKASVWHRDPGNARECNCRLKTRKLCDLIFIIIYSCSNFGSLCLLDRPDDTITEKQEG